MSEPTVCCGAVPELDISWNMNDSAGQYLYSRFAFFLIPATSGYSDKHLTATFCCVVNMPVIAAARLKCHIKNANLTLRYQSKKALSTEILCKTIVWCTDWEYHLFGMCSHCFIFIWKIALVYIPYFFCQVKNCPALWPACVKSYMCDDCSDLFLCHAMCFCVL